MRLDAQDVLEDLLLDLCVSPVPFKRYLKEMVNGVVFSMAMRRFMKPLQYYRLLEKYIMTHGKRGIECEWHYGSILYERYLIYEIENKHGRFTVLVYKLIRKNSGNHRKREEEILSALKCLSPDHAIDIDNYIRVGRCIPPERSICF